MFCFHTLPWCILSLSLSELSKLTLPGAMSEGAANNYLMSVEYWGWFETFLRMFFWYHDCKAKWKYTCSNAILYQIARTNDLNGAGSQWFNIQSGKSIPVHISFKLRIVIFTPPILLDRWQFPRRTSLSPARCGCLNVRPRGQAIWSKSSQVYGIFTIPCLEAGPSQKQMVWSDDNWSPGDSSKRYLADLIDKSYRRCVLLYAVKRANHSDERIRPWFCDVRQ